MTDPGTLSLIQDIRDRAGADIEDATTLPSAVYWSRDFYDLEKAQVLKREWLPVARVEQVPEVGSYVAVDLPDEPVLVVRGGDHTVRAFSRVCRHRYEDILGGATAPEARRSGCTQLLECPYHSWTYRPDGSLAHAIDFSNRPDFNSRGYGLNEIDTAIWQGFVFVKLDPTSSVTLDLSGLARVQEGYDFTNWTAVRTVDWGECPVNWKILVENFLECYHHVGTHKQTLQPLWPMGTVEPGADEHTDHWYYARMKAGAETAAGEQDGHLVQPVFLPADPALSTAQRSESLLLARFPTFLLAAAPDVTYWYQPIPTGPDTHRLFIHLLVPNTSLGAPDFDEGLDKATEFVKTFHAEDDAVNATVQSSLKSIHAVGGPLHAQELPILRLQQFLAARLNATTS